MLTIKKPQFPLHDDKDDHSVEGLLLDLENAIKPLQDPSKPNELSDYEHSFENAKDTDDQEDDVEFDEDFVLKEIEFCETDEDMKELLENEESKLVFSSESAYKFLYKKSIQKSFIMMKIIKGFLNKNQVINNIKAKCDELSKKLEAQIKENVRLKCEKNEVKKLSDEIMKKLNAMTQKFEGAVSEIKLYEGDPKALVNLDINTVLEMEQKFQFSIQKIAEFKTKVLLIIVGKN